MDLFVDASRWLTTRDAWDDLSVIPGFPEWHGRNANALLDSIQPGQINRVEEPYRLHVLRAATLTAEGQNFLDMLTDVFRRAKERGADVDLEIGR